MCGRFININKIDRLKKTFYINESKNINYNISYNISPSQSSIIITNINSFFIESANWGFKFFDKKENVEKNIINSRLESIKNKLIFKESFEKRKCIIPANGYYEWAIHNNVKIPYFIQIPNLEPIYFAGIWKYVNFKINSFKLFSIITKSSNNSLKEIHKRMPIILSLDEAKYYLEKNNFDYLDQSFHSIIEDYLMFSVVSKFVNNPFNNSEECIKSIN